MLPNKVGRAVALKALKLTARDITIKHHWVPDQKLKLNSFRHKGFWWHGRNRERQTMHLFEKCIPKGSMVVEVGGHIGYITQYFSWLVGSAGNVMVFEPGQNNLPYIRNNTQNCKNVTLVEKGVGAELGEFSFFEESLTGQNNSFVRDFDGLRNNQQAAFTAASVTERKVEVVTLDSVVAGQSVSFIKIDVEGFEYSVLRGAAETLKSLPVIMVEVQADRDEILSYFKSRGYSLFNDSGAKLCAASQLNGNVFAFHSRQHESLLRELRFWQ